MTTTDTPRTDACPQCGDDHPSQHPWGFFCLEGYIEQLEAEVERLKDNLASAIEIAEILGRPFVTDARSRQLHHKLDQLKATLNPDKK